MIDWKELFIKSAKWVGGLFAAAFAWVALGEVGFASQALYDAGFFIVTVGAFILGLPLTLVLRIDRIVESYPNASNWFLLVAMGLVVYANFILVGAYRRWSSARERKKGGD